MFVSFHCLNLANLYARGLGGAHDYFEAARWFQAAANQGHAVAQHNLGALYLGGLGVPRNDSLAAGWIKLAAEHRYAVAERDLGRLYQTGRGLPLDYVQAYVWYSCAIIEGDRSARSLLKGLSHVMTPAQVEQAKSILRMQTLPLEQVHETALEATDQPQVPDP